MKKNQFAHSIARRLTAGLVVAALLAAPMVASAAPRHALLPADATPLPNMIATGRPSPLPTTPGTIPLPRLRPITTITTTATATPTWPPMRPLPSAPSPSSASSPPSAPTDPHAFSP